MESHSIHRGRAGDFVTERLSVARKSVCSSSRLRGALQLPGQMLSANCQGLRYLKLNFVKIKKLSSRTASVCLWALNSAVECHLHTVEVIGSNPIAPTIFAVHAFWLCCDSAQVLRLCSGFRLAAPTPPKRLKFESYSAHHICCGRSGDIGNRTYRRHGLHFWPEGIFEGPQSFLLQVYITRKNGLPLGLLRFHVYNEACVTTLPQLVEAVANAARNS